MVGTIEQKQLNRGPLAPTLSLDSEMQDSRAVILFYAKLLEHHSPSWSHEALTAWEFLIKTCMAGTGEMAQWLKALIAVHWG